MKNEVLLLPQRGPAQRWTWCAVLPMLLLGCAGPRSASTDLDGPIFGASKPTVITVAPTDELIHATDLAKVAKVVARYKTLDQAERALVKSAVAKRLHGLVALEVQRVEARYRSERASISRLPDRAAATQRMAELDERIRREATAAVIKRLGALVAVPLKTSDNRSAVAFARIGERAIEVAADAGEIDRPIASLTNGDRVQTAARTVASFIDAPPATVAASR